jgi:hypothetical protein
MTILAYVMVESFGDALDFIMCEIENFIGANRNTFFSLGKGM